MKSLIFTFIAISILGTQVAHAQFNPTTTNMPTNAATVGTHDTTLECGGISTYPSLLPASAATWTLSGLSYTGNNVINHSAVMSGSPFPALGFMDNLNSYSSQIFSITDTGIFRFGLHVTRTAVFTGTAAGDSLITPTQDIVLATPNKVLPFPAPVGTHWSNIGDNSLAINLTIMPLYNNTPGEFKHYVTEFDTIKGYGNMSVKTDNGGMSVPYPVLQLKRVTITVDSFFLGGTPAPANLVALLSATQGQIDTTYEMVFYRANETTPLVTVSFYDKADTSVKTGTVHSVFGILGVHSTSINNDGINLYPNPMTGNTLHVSLGEGKAGNWAYEVMDMNGKVVANSTLNLSATDKTADITFATTLTKGIYFVSLMNNGTVVAVKPISIEN